MFPSHDPKEALTWVIKFWVFIKPPPIKGSVWGPPVFAAVLNDGILKLGTPPIKLLTPLLSSLFISLKFDAVTGPVDKVPGLVCEEKLEWKILAAENLPSLASSPKSKLLSPLLSVVDEIVLRVSCDLLFLYN